MADVESGRSGGDPPQRDMDPSLRVLTRDPDNAETPLAEQPDSITPIDLFYRRNRFRQPDLSRDGWSLRIEGLVNMPLTLTYDDILALPARTLAVTLECAGNGRSAFVPPAEGEPWQWGAVSTARWTGVPLAAVLQRAGVLPSAREILFVGADGGSVDASGERVPFARSLPLEQALHPDVLLAHGMNGEVLPRAHGYPLRLVVPGWYGMASVKWLVRIAAIQEPFAGFFQADRYILPAPDGQGTVPLREVRVRSLILSPRDGEVLSPGTVQVTGLAWGGEAEVARVDVSLDGGSTWQPATWTSQDGPYAWRGWQFSFEAEEERQYRLASRAIDARGAAQPMQADWNRLGYANNAITVVAVTCDRPAPGEGGR